MFDRPSIKILECLVKYRLNEINVNGNFVFNFRGFQFVLNNNICMCAQIDPLLHILMKHNIDSNVFSMFLKQPNLNVNVHNDLDEHVIRAVIDIIDMNDTSIENLYLLLQHKDITPNIVKKNIKRIEKFMFSLTKQIHKEYLDMLYKYVETVESGNKWIHKTFQKNNESNNVQTLINEENQNKNKNNKNAWKYKELWENIVLQAFNVTNKKEFPDLWLHLLIEYCNVNTASVLKLRYI